MTSSIVPFRRAAAKEPVVVELDPARLGSLGPLLAEGTAMTPVHPRLVLFVAGSGNTGKTRWTHWAAERAVERNAKLSLATVDVINRELTRYPQFRSKDGLPGVWQPMDGESPASFLASYLNWLSVDNAASAIIDLGGGDTSLAETISQLGGGADVIKMFDIMKITPVLVILLGPRVANLTVLKQLRDIGFQPPATLLVKNLGVANGVAEFDALCAQPTYQDAIKDGAVAVWMPCLYCASTIELEHLSFAQARQRFGLAGKLQLSKWQQLMEEKHEIVRSWLPGVEPGPTAA